MTFPSMLIALLNHVMPTALTSEAPKAPRRRNAMSCCRNINVLDL